MDHDLFARSGGIEVGGGGERPAYFKAVGIALAIGSGVFIGTSFVLKKVGLLRANEKYNEVAGEGYGYLKNAFWWSGMILMIVGEICNFVAYAFVDAILVTPLGALSVVITTVLSAIFLKERLSMVGKVACFLCIVGSVVIVMNAPHTSSVADISEMRDFFITPGFLSYAGVIIVGSVITAFWLGPKYGKKNMLVYISICSWIGGLSVVATQGLGAGIVAWISGKPEYKEWFFWVLLAFVVATLLTEIIFLNKALNLFNAALVTPTYYVYFTSTTIITSAILFQGFKGTVSQIVTVVLGFLTICSGVVLLQLSKSAKDVPDAAVFTGDLDQIHTIAEQEQPESEPKADAIRGTAAIVRRISKSRMKMEAEEMRRLHEEKTMEAMEPIEENGGAPQYEWDGLRRRRTMTPRTRAATLSSPPQTPWPPVRDLGNRPLPSTPTSAHPPLGMSRFPTDAEMEEFDRDDRSTIFSSIAGTIRGRARTNASMPAYAPSDDQPARHTSTSYSQHDKPRSPMHPVPLTEISVPAQKPDDEADSYYGPTRAHSYFTKQDTSYRSMLAERRPGTGSRTGSSGSRLESIGEGEARLGGSEGRVNRDTTRSVSPGGHSLKPPTPPPHGTARRQFSFQNVFRRSQTHASASEEESVGLVKEDEIHGQQKDGYM